MNWKLVRQDTHGTRFDVASFDTEEDALRAMADYESGYPHHQTYYVERQRVVGEAQTPPEIVAQRPLDDVAGLARSQPQGMTLRFEPDQRFISTTTIDPNSLSARIAGLSIDSSRLEMTVTQHR